MDDIVCKSGKSLERLRPIEIGNHRHRTERAQRLEVLRGSR
jgi:hypothetical protein